MNLSKSILVFSTLFLLIGILPALAQREGGTGTLTQLKISGKGKAAFVEQLKALKDVGPSARQATASVSLNDIKGFNLGMPPGRSSQVIHIIFAEVRSDIRRADRSNMDALKTSPELISSFEKMGVDPAKGMAFQFNTQTLKIERFSGPSGTGKN